MAVVNPNLQDSPAFDAQAVRDSVDLFAMVGSDAVVVSGMVVSTFTTMVINIAAGAVSINGTTYNYSGGTATVTAASTSDRRDTVIYTAGTGVQVIAGTPCGLLAANWTRNVTSNSPPVKQLTAIPANSVILAEAYVGYSTTTVAAANLVDKRLLQSFSGSASLEQAIRIQSLDQMSPPASDLFINNRRIINMANPIWPTDAGTAYAGMSNVSGAPTTGTWVVGNWIIDSLGRTFYCTVAGTPGTWVQANVAPASPGTNTQTLTSTVAATAYTATTAVTHLTTAALAIGTYQIDGVLTVTGAAALSATAYLTAVGTSGTNYTWATGATGPVAAINGSSATSLFNTGQIGGVLKVLTAGTVTVSLISGTPTGTTLKYTGVITAVAGSPTGPMITLTATQIA